MGLVGLVWWDLFFYGGFFVCLVGDNCGYKFMMVGRKREGFLLKNIRCSILNGF